MEMEVVKELELDKQVAMTLVGAPVDRVAAMVVAL
jgi:hypothetical protein